MIKAPDTAKVKERLRLNAKHMFLNFLLPALLVSPLCFAQTSEKDMQKLEEQEFGIGTGRKSKNGADERPNNIPEDYQPETEAERLKEIEAEDFPVRLKKTSSSGRVLLLEDPSENRPRPGKILLLKHDKDNIAAIRVLKNYPGRFAGKIVLPFTNPTVNREYRALKKLGNKILQMIRERERRLKDLDADKTDEELAREVAPDDSELDRGIPKPKPPSKKPAPEKKKDRPEALFDKDGNDLLTMDNIEVRDEEEPYADVSIQEESPLEPYRSALSVQYAGMRSVDKENAPTTQSSFGARYGFNVWRGVFWNRKTFQDMLTLELGIFRYSIIGFIESTDEVVVYSIVGTLRYNLLLGENFSIYGYTGFVRNNVSVSEGVFTDQTALLDTTKAALGLGLMIKIGPAWAIRTDFGTDLFGIGGVLKF